MTQLEKFEARYTALAALPLIESTVEELLKLSIQIRRVAWNTDQKPARELAEKALNRANEFWDPL